MDTDYRINLAKSLTSTIEQRTRFYKGMILYLVLCLVGLGYVAYASADNIQRYIVNKQKEHLLVASASAVSGFGAATFRNPDTVYNELQAYSGQIDVLKQVLSMRVQLLPIIHNLFVELPQGASLQSLSATKDKMAFGVLVPPTSGASGDPVRQLTAAWEKNGELMRRVAAIRPVIGERRMIGAESFFYVQFECILKK